MKKDYDFNDDLDELEDIEEADQYEDTYEDTYGDEDFEDSDPDEDGEYDDGFLEENRRKPVKKYLALKILCGVAAVILIAVILIRFVGLGAIGKLAEKSFNKEDANSAVTGTAIDFYLDEDGNPVYIDDSMKSDEETDGFSPRSEDYVTTYLIFGIEEINGAANTDAIMLVSINTKDNTIKLCSLLRDTYVQIPGWDKNKLNSAYAKGAHGAETSAEAKANGAALLIKTIEQTYDIKIHGYASVNFSSFEKIIDRLGGVDIELGEKEAAYLNKTNYISEPSNRCVKAGWNHLNGNQAMGYVRVRKCVTLGGANNDYGRTVRQRRVINAIIKKYTSSNITELIPIMTDCMGYINSNLTADQVTKALTDVFDNGIFTTNSMRLPADELFKDSGSAGIWNGSRNVTWTLVIEGYEEENIKKLHSFVFLDPEVTDEATGQ